ncbi:MAG TPA: hypothetical protein VLK23_12785 [Thermodesulfobacteriota bacterium]|nr:hypothetical protein [Thermodesulfobacteriota bacterium]
METAIKEEKGTTAVEENKGKKRKWWNAFINFLAYGGFLLVMVAIVGIVILISVLTK